MGLKNSSTRTHTVSRYDYILARMCDDYINNKIIGKKLKRQGHKQRQEYDQLVINEIIAVK